jgi:hypothetical protein
MKTMTKLQKYYNKMMEETTEIIDDMIKNGNVNGDILRNAKAKLTVKHNSIIGPIFMCESCDQIYKDMELMRSKSFCMKCYRKYHRTHYKNNRSRAKKKMSIEERRKLRNANQKRRYQMKKTRAQFQKVMNELKLNN